jgi:tRNA (guanine-N1)-methyltransferase
MQFDVITLFPEMFTALTQSGITRRAFEQSKCKLSMWNPRDFTNDKHKTVDDRPYGGGPGMVIQAEPVAKAIDKAISIAQKKSKSKKVNKHLDRSRIFCQTRRICVRWTIFPAKSCLY